MSETAAQYVFHLNCGEMTPKCGYDCARCIQELTQVLEAIAGVSGVSFRGSGAEARIVIECDPSRLSRDQAARRLRSLPTFYSGRFLPISAPDNG
jgi:hypothetical protein